MDTASLIAKLGLNNSEFKAKLKDSMDQGKDFKRGWKDIGDLFAFGGITASVVTFFKTVIDYAKNAKGELDENVRAVKAFGEGIDGLKESAMKGGALVLGTFNRLGEAIGEAVNIARQGWSAWAEGQEKLDATAAAAERAEKALAESKKHAGEFKKAAEDIRQAEEARREIQLKALTTQERINQLQNEVGAAEQKLLSIGEDKLARQQATADLRKLENKLLSEQIDYEKQLAAEDQKHIEEKAKDEAKLAAMQEEWDEEEMERLIDKERQEREAIEASEKSPKILDDELKKLEEQGMSREQIIAQLRIQGFSEGDILKTMVKQNEAKFVALKITGKTDSQLSDRALQDKVNTLNSQIADRSFSLRFADGSFGRAGLDPFMGIQQSYLEKAQTELQARDRIRKQVSQFGEEGAARFYQGNIGEFERLLEFVKSSPDTKKTVNLLDEINERLKPVFEKR